MIAAHLKVSTPTQVDPWQKKSFNSRERRKTIYKDRSAANSVDDTERSPLKNPRRPQKRNADDPSPHQILLERQVATAEAEQQHEKALILAREHTNMITEHVAALTRERYELLYSCGMSNNEIWRDSQGMAVWDIQGQHIHKGDPIACWGDINADGTNSYSVSIYGERQTHHGTTP